MRRTTDHHRRLSTGPRGGQGGLAESTSGGGKTQSRVGVNKKCRKGSRRKPYYLKQDSFLREKGGKATNKDVTDHKK